MSRRPLVSVVTPSRDYGRYIGDCLESVRRQTYPEIEHIVLDACSADGTQEVVRSFEGRYRLRAVFERDEGQADAINKGFAQARGDVLCWLNADDFWLADTAVEAAVRALETGADVATAGGCYVDSGGRRLRRIRARTPGQIARDLRHFDVILQPATFWRRAIHRPVRTELHYAFDWALFIEMLQAGARFASIPEEWAAYRWHTVGKTASDPAGRRGETVTIMREQFGEGSPQHLWARFVHAGYLAAERRRSPVLERAIKRGVYLANVAVAVATRNRICSW
jgi:glycosyltransferase involved in cell wall biosynthesis